jgi:hypothetical protein
MLRTLVEHYSPLVISFHSSSFLITVRPEAVPLAASGNTGEQAKDGGGGGGGGRDPKDIYHLPLQEVERKDVPAPRGGHSATMVGSEFMWLFGGDRLVAARLTAVVVVVVDIFR